MFPKEICGRDTNERSHRRHRVAAVMGCIGDQRARIDAPPGIDSIPVKPLLAHYSGNSHHYSPHIGSRKHFPVKHCSNSLDAAHAKSDGHSKQYNTYQ